MEIQVPGKGPEIYDKLKTKFLDYKAQGKLKALGEIHWDDASCSAKATGTGFKSTIKCHDGKIVVDLDLNFLLKAMRGQIEETIQKIVAKAFP
jgi:hypothetical protein